MAAWHFLCSHMKLHQADKMPTLLNYGQCLPLCVCFAVNAWLSAVASDDAAVDDSSRFQNMKQINDAAVADSSSFQNMKEINKQLSIPQSDQLTAQQVDLTKFIPEDDTSTSVDLMLGLGSAGGDKVIRRGVKVGASDYSGSVSDLTAEVDFEIGPDVSSECPCNFSRCC